MATPHKTKVCIIGSGISGLQCARNLRALGVEVVVLEAAEYVGGRIRQNSSFIDGVKVGSSIYCHSACLTVHCLRYVQLDLGAEMVHKDGIVLHELLMQLNEPMQKLFIWAQGDGGPLEEKGKTPCVCWVWSLPHPDITNSK